MLIPNPTGFLVLKVIRILVQAFLASHSSPEGFGEFHGVSVVGIEVVIAGFVVVPSRYPVIPFNDAIDKMLLLQVGQLVPSNLSVSLNIGGMLSPDEVIFGVDNVVCQFCFV